MTFLEKLKEDNPSRNDVWYRTQVNEYCPHEYGYGESKLKNCGYGENCDPELCVECWNREMPDTEQWVDKEKEWFIEGFKKGKADGVDEGMAKVWEFVKEIYNFTFRKTDDIFGYEQFIDVLTYLTPQEALAKLKEYEEEQEIKVGDVMFIYGENAVVTRIKGELVYVLFGDGTTNYFDVEDIKTDKTGKRLDLTQIFEQIGE